MLFIQCGAVSPPTLADYLKSKEIIKRERIIDIKMAATSQK